MNRALRYQQAEFASEVKNYIMPVKRCKAKKNALQGILFKNKEYYKIY